MSVWRPRGNVLALYDNSNPTTHYCLQTIQCYRALFFINSYILNEDITQHLCETNSVWKYNTEFNFKLLSSLNFDLFRTQYFRCKNPLTITRQLQFQGIRRGMCYLIVGTTEFKALMSQWKACPYCWILLYCTGNAAQFPLSQPRYNHCFRVVTFFFISEPYIAAFLVISFVKCKHITLYLKTSTRPLYTLGVLPRKSYNTGNVSKRWFWGLFVNFNPPSLDF